MKLRSTNCGQVTDACERVRRQPPELSHGKPPPKETQSNRSGRDSAGHSHTCAPPKGLPAAGGQGFPQVADSETGTSPSLTGRSPRGTPGIGFRRIELARNNQTSVRGLGFLRQPENPELFMCDRPALARAVCG